MIWYSYFAVQNVYWSSCNGRVVARAGGKTVQSNCMERQGIVFYKDMSTYPKSVTLKNLVQVSGVLHIILFLFLSSMFVK